LHNSKIAVLIFEVLGYTKINYSVHLILNLEFISEWTSVSPVLSCNLARHSRTNDSECVRSWWLVGSCIHDFLMVACGMQ